MKAKLIFLLFVLFIFFAACSKEKPADTSRIPTNPAAPQEIQHTALPTVNKDFTSLEVTPSGEPKCFLSPCNCNCYVIPNVPIAQKKPTCATNCQAEYGITGCRFTNFQCYTLT